jgi:N-acetylmuramoyl-L-alanine amidase
MNYLQKISSTILATVMILVLTTLAFLLLYNAHREFENPQDSPQHFAISFDRLTKDTQTQLFCLAENIYFEARNEPVEGMLAVAFVTMNRVNDSRYPDNICDVVKEKTRNRITGRTVCQFSWWCEEKPHHISINNILTKDSNLTYNKIMGLALQFYMNQDNMEDPTMGALFYHADYVSPNWKNLTPVTKIGRHIFYEERNKRNAI